MVSAVGVALSAMAEAMARLPPLLFKMRTRSLPLAPSSVPPVMVEGLPPTLPVSRMPSVTVSVPPRLTVDAAAPLKRRAVTATVGGAVEARAVAGENLVGGPRRGVVRGDVGCGPDGIGGAAGGRGPVVAAVGDAGPQQAVAVPGGGGNGAGGADIDGAADVGAVRAPRTSVLPAAAVMADCAGVDRQAAHGLRVAGAGVGSRGVGERAAADGQGVAGTERAEERQRAAGDARPAGVEVGGGEGQDAAADLREAAGAGDHAAVGRGAGVVAAHRQGGGAQEDVAAGRPPPVREPICVL